MASCLSTGSLRQAAFFLADPLAAFFLIATSLGGLAIEKPMRFAIPFALLADWTHTVRTQRLSLQAGHFHLQLQLRAITSGSGIVPPIDFLQPPQSHEGVKLSGGNVAMTEDRLYGAEISAVFHYVRCATVAQHMRRNVPMTLDLTSHDRT
jgi:hypothetical protein